MNVIDLEDLLNDARHTQRQCWPGASAVHHARKLQKEAAELEQAPHVEAAEEAADCLICLLVHCAARGITAEELGAATVYKLAKCRRQKWVRQPDGTYQHVPGGPPAVARACKVGCDRRCVMAAPELHGVDADWGRSADAPDAWDRFRT